MPAGHGCTWIPSDLAEIHAMSQSHLQRCRKARFNTDSTIDGLLDPTYTLNTRTVVGCFDISYWYVGKEELLFNARIASPKMKLGFLFLLKDQYTQRSCEIEVQKSHCPSKKCQPQMGLFGDLKAGLPSCEVPFSAPMMLIFGGKGFEHVKERW